MRPTLWSSTVCLTDGQFAVWPVVTWIHREGDAWSGFRMACQTPKVQTIIHPRGRGKIPVVASRAKKGIQVRKDFTVERRETLRPRSIS